jgi:hypothetical protein
MILHGFSTMHLSHDCLNQINSVAIYTAKNIKRSVQDSNLRTFLLQRTPLDHSGNRPFF